MAGKISDINTQITSKGLINGNAWLKLDQNKSAYVRWFLDGYVSTGKTRELPWNSINKHDPIVKMLEVFYSKRQNRLIPVCAALSGYILPKLNPDYSEEWLDRELEILRKMYKRIEAKPVRESGGLSDEAKELQARFEANRALLDNAPEQTISLKNGNFWMKMNVAKRQEYVETLAEGSLSVMPLWEREKNPFYHVDSGTIKITRLFNEIYSDPEYRLIPLSFLLQEYAFPKMLAAKSESTLKFILIKLQRTFADDDAVKAFLDGANTPEAIERVQKHFASKRKESAKTVKSSKKPRRNTRKPSVKKQTGKGAG